MTMLWWNSDIESLCFNILKSKLIKLATPPRLKAHVLLVASRAYDLATGHYVFIESCTLLSADTDTTTLF